MIIALAGRRIDATDADTARFPLGSVALVRDRLLALFRARNATALVASAACGADLIAHDVARSLGLYRVMVFPYEPDVFRERSVTDRPGDWGPLFLELFTDARRTGEVIELNESRDPQASSVAYRHTNEAILDRAASLVADSKGEAVLPVVVWDGMSRGPDDLTAAFVQAASSRGFVPFSVPTIPERPQLP